jgi:phosphoglycerate dehydrogenase-like enzyme
VVNLTPHITGSKKQSEERAALFAVRVHVLVMRLFDIHIF